MLTYVSPRSTTATENRIKQHHCEIPGKCLLAPSHLGHFRKTGQHEPNRTEQMRGTTGEGATEEVPSSQGGKMPNGGQKKETNLWGAFNEVLWV